MKRDILFRYWDGEKIICPHETKHETLLEQSANIFKYQDTAMQSVGIYDKNGQLIYEGDILHCYNTYGTMYKEGPTGVIEYKDNCFALKCNGIYLEGWINAEYYEIVGNIYNKPN